MSLVLWGASGFLLGMLGFIGLPFVAASRERWQQPTIDGYGKLLAQAMGQSALVKRKQTGVDLVTWSTDGERTSIQFDLDGETVDVTDPDGLMGHLYNYPFALIDEATASVTDPELAALGTTAKNDGPYWEDETEVLDLPAADAYVDPSMVRYVTDGDRDGNDAEQEETFIEKSQTLFDNRSAVELAALMMAFGIGFGLTFVGVKYGGGGGSPINVPMLLGGFL